MRRAGPILLGLACLCGPAGATGLQNPLSAPQDISLAPAPPAPLVGPMAGSLPGATPNLLQGGVVSQSFGSGGMRSTAVELDSGLIGGNTRAFLQAATGQGPRYHDLPVVSGSTVAVGAETALPGGITLGVSAGVQQNHLLRGGPVSLVP